MRHYEADRCFSVIRVDKERKLEVEKQESLPFPPTPSASRAGRTMQESVYHRRVDAAPAAGGRPQHPHRAHRRCRPRLASTYGGEVRTPTSIASPRPGISYNRFHTTAMCSPTRAALLTGRNHHRVGNGQIAELANDWDGYSGIIPKSCAHRRRGAQELRIQDRRLRQMAQHARRANHRRRPLRLLADRTMASSISTASSPAKPRNMNRTSCGTPPRPAAQRPPNKAIT